MIIIRSWLEMPEGCWDGHSLERVGVNIACSWLEMPKEVRDSLVLIGLLRTFLHTSRIKFPSLLDLPFLDHANPAIRPQSPTRAKNNPLASVLERISAVFPCGE